MKPPCKEARRRGDPVRKEERRSQVCSQPKGRSSRRDGRCRRSRGPRRSKRHPQDKVALFSKLKGALIKRGRRLPPKERSLRRVGRFDRLSKEAAGREIPPAWIGRRWRSKGFSFGRKAHFEPMSLDLQGPDDTGQGQTFPGERRRHQNQPRFRKIRTIERPRKNIKPKSPK